MKMLFAATIVFLVLQAACLSAQDQPAKDQSKEPQQKDEEFPMIKILGQGLLPNVASGGPATESIQGSLGVAYASRYFQTVLSISSSFQSAQISSSDPKDFGKSILHPGNQSQAATLDMTGLRLYDFFYCKGVGGGDMKAYSKVKPTLGEDLLNAFALHLSASFARLQWQAEPPLVLTAQKEQVDLFSIDFGIALNIINETYLKNDFLVSFEFGLPIRSLFGDALADPGFRRALLGTESSVFMGFETSMTLAINGLIARFSYVQIGGRDVPGLTSGDMSVSVGVQVGILNYVFQKPGTTP